MESDAGLVFAFILDGRGSGKNVDWQGVETWDPSVGLLWTHFDYSDEKVQDWLINKSGFPEIVRDALVDDETRPRYVIFSEGVLVNLRGVNCNPGADPDDMVALRMFFSEKRIVSMRHRRVMAVDDVNKALNAGQGPVSEADFLVMITDRISNRMGDVISDLSDGVDELEDEILSGNSYEILSSLALMRRQAIRLRRFISPQRDVLSRIYQEKISWMYELEKQHLREAADRTTRFVEDIDSIRERTAIMSEELNNKLSEQMNKAMYLLSIVAAIFLPLGLITGLLGINVGGIPGTDYKMAFTIVSLFLIVIAFGLLILFKRIKWI